MWDGWVMKYRKRLSGDLRIAKKEKFSSFYIDALSEQTSHKVATKRSARILKVEVIKPLLEAKVSSSSKGEK
jgi:hypothetical protein